MDDEELIRRIGALADEEHRLEQDHHGSGPGLSDEDAGRLRQIEGALDQCWDLLRQRRARREFGQDPDVVEARDVGTVEGFQQ